MKRQEFIRMIERAGCQLVRHGSRHDLYLNPARNLKQPVPRHTEINDHLAAHIWKHLGLSEESFKK